MPTKIEWTDESWNPVTGCTPVSEGCAHCYAKRMTKRFGGDFSKVTLHPDRLEIPLRWRKPRMVFVPSMGDLFHEDVPPDFIQDVFQAMMNARQHTYQVLTKRPERMRRILGNFHWWAEGIGGLPFPELRNHVWLGVSVEDQARADERIPLLLDTPAAVRFVSVEPLLGPLDLSRYLSCIGRTDHRDHMGCRWLDWVIVGGESGGPPERRLVERCGCKGLFDGVENQTCIGCHDTGWGVKLEARAWVRDIRDQCQEAGVAFFFKQWGGPSPKAGGWLLDSREWREMPDASTLKEPAIG